MEKLKYRIFVSVKTLKGKRLLGIALGPYTRKRDTIRGLKRLLPKSFTFSEGLIQGALLSGKPVCHEKILDIRGGKIITEDAFSRKKHTYKF